jgi:hypothetical protein
LRAIAVLIPGGLGAQRDISLYSGVRWHNDMKISLTPGQAVTLHGWMRARQWLTWGDVLGKEGLGFSELLACNLPEQELYVLQPDLQAWVRAGKATLQDCPRMRSWDAHPIRDFKADLADMIGMHWPPETLTRMGVTYDELLELGLTAETMTLFNYTLMMWFSVGFQRRHAETVPPNTLFRLFGMSKMDVMACLR